MNNVSNSQNEMLTEQRLQAFQHGLAQLQQECGVTLVAEVQTEKLGEAVLTRPLIRAQLIEGWQPQVEQEQPVN